MKLFKQIIRSGVSYSDDHLQARGIVLSNYISLILCISVILLFVLRWLQNGFFLSSLITGFLLFLSPVIFNRFSQTTVSRLYLCYMPVIFLWYVFISNLKDANPVEASMYDGLRLFLLAVSFIPYLLFENSKPIVLMLGILPTFVSFLLFEYILSWAGVGGHQLGITGTDYELIQTRGIVCYLIVSASCYAFLFVINQNDKVNRELMIALKNKTEEIEVQNEELVQSQEKLNELNLHLEELVASKTHSIEVQNEKLTRYAYSNAHYVRGPIARLLGLIQLAKLEREPDYKWYFRKLEHETIEIDLITRRIAQDLNNQEAQTLESKNQESQPPSRTDDVSRIPVI